MRSKLALGLLCCAFFIDVMGSTSVFTASPALENGLGLTQTGLQWSLTAATLPAGALRHSGSATQLSGSRWRGQGFHIIEHGAEVAGFASLARRV